MQAVSSSPSASPAMRLLQAALVLAVACFAWLRFSDNTVDNDLWGHVLYGQRYWNLGHVRGPEPFSWTAGGFDIVNHEYLAEIAMGFVHRVAGGTGLWLYMMGMAALTVGLALLPGKTKSATSNWTGLVLFAASINFIALGFAVRPQLFTTLFLVVELLLLRVIANGHRGAGIILLLLFAIWGNLHGGVLAGVVVLAAIVAAETLQARWPRVLPASWKISRPPRRNLGLYWALLSGAVVALLLNPWGYRLLEWNLRATLRPRPQIHEWHPLALSAANAPYYIVAAISLLAWIYSRQPKKLGEAFTLLLLAVMGILHQRHAPLFGLANLVFTPVHLADVAGQIAPRCHSLITLFTRPAGQIGGAAALFVAAGAALFASFSAPKEHPFTMEVERNVYPVTAVEFMQAHRLFGKTITFFDWGQQSLWELPENPVSFDGRFDTGYPPRVIAAHWDFYNGKGMSPDVNWNEADVALLPANGGGAELLVRNGWRPVYQDPLAVVLVPSHGPHATFRLGQPIERRGVEVLQGRKPFPDNPPRLAAVPTRP
jgi:hypothetical protein